MSKTRNNFNQNDVLKKVRSVYITKKILDNLNKGKSIFTGNENNNDQYFNIKEIEIFKYRNRNNT